MKQELYLLIDSSGILFHQYYGMKNALNKEKNKINIKGKEIDFSAIVGYFNFVEKIKQEYDGVPNQNIVHILDSETGSKYRKELYPEYKANRKEKEEDLIFQKRMLGSFLQAMNEKYLEIDDVEADDVIGTLSNRLSNEGHNVLIISYDKDLLQLLNENVALSRYEKIKGYDNKMFNYYSQDYVHKNYGFPPETFVDYLALIGDISDNIPGVKGIGDKAAKELLKEFINVEDILLNIDKIKPKYKNKIENYKEELILSKKLAVIQKNIDNIPNINEVNYDINPILRDNLRKILRTLNVIDF